MYWHAHGCVLLPFRRVLFKDVKIQVRTVFMLFRLEVRIRIKVRVRIWVLGRF